MPEIKEVVKEKYGQAALRVMSGEGSSLLRQAGAVCGSVDPITANLYDAAADQRTAGRGGAGFARLRQSDRAGATEARARWCSTSARGGGIDVLLSAKRVGPTGKAYGLDMTDEMLALARENQRKPASKTWSS